MIRIPFEQLNLKPSDIEVVMGFEPGETPEPYKHLIKEALYEAAGLCHPCGGYVIYPASQKTETGHGWTLGEAFIDPGRIISSQLVNSISVAVFVCTVGSAVSEYSGKLMNNGDLINGYIFDTLGSVAVEKAMDILHEHLAAEVKSRGLAVTNRYSPGYCGWDVSAQQFLFSLLPENFCGVRLLASSLMIPVKSVSGIIGIGEKVKYNPYICNLCGQANCLYVRRNNTQKHHKYDK